MSKSYCGLFSGTMGALNTQQALTLAVYNEIVSTIANNAKGHDLRQHRLPYKIPSAKRLKNLRQKRDNRTITKQEFRELRWAERFKERRDKGVSNFWDAEKAKLLRGEKGTRNWTKEQRNDIINDRRPKFNGRVIQGHHSYSASKYPQLANLGGLIYPATFREHLYGWHGGTYRKSLPGMPIKIIIEF